MAKSKQNDLIQSVCGNSGRVFCESYKKTNRECRLLREDRMEEFWNHCRYKPFEKLYETINVHLRKFRQKYQNLPIDDNEDIDFQSIINRLKKIRLKTGFTLVDWRNYMHKTVYMEIKSVLVRRGLLPKTARCGTCKYLTESKPYACLKKGENRKKGDEICEAYAQKIDTFISMNGVKADDDVEKERLMLEMAETHHEDAITPETILEEKEERNKLLFIKEILKKRIKDAEAGSKYRKKCERQYEIFINLLNLFSKGISKEDEAFRILVKKHGLSIRTIQRDVFEIREFLKKNVR